MPVIFSSLNVNGMNARDKHFKVNQFLKKHKIDILLVQEHNLKSNDCIKNIDMDYDVYINNSILHKGGTAIFIRKNAGINVINVQYHSSSRIICMNIKINDLYFKILNIYGHSGPNLKTDREDFFAQEMLFYLQGNLENIIIGGDFNCIISEKILQMFIHI